MEYSSSSSGLRYPEVQKYYELHETLGSGGFAKVKLGTHKLTGEKVAVKIMDKIQLGEDLHRVYREIRALKQLHHQHVCQLFHVIETERMIYVIIEYCPGGELFDYIVAKERLRENESRAFFRQIVSALMYVHTSGFIHRDLKPENLLLDENSNIKLIDFGLVAEPQDISELLRTCCGSPAYAAPELIQGGPYIGPKADVWSLGVLLYALLNGFLPFDDDNTAELYRLIQNGKYDVPVWLSDGSRRMLQKLLQTRPEHRITVEELLSHSWVMAGYQRQVDWQSKFDLNKLDDNCVEELAKYHGFSESAMAKRILEWSYDNITATYFLLQQQKMSGRTPHIKAPPKRHGSGPTCPSPLIRVLSKKEQNLSSLGKTDSDDEDEDDEDDEDEEDEQDEQEDQKVPQIQPRAAARSRKISLGQPMHPPTLGEIISLQKPIPEKRRQPIIPPAITAIKNDLSPVESHKTLTLPPIVSPTRHEYQVYTPQLQPRVPKTFSFDSRLNYAVSFEPVSEPSPRRRKRFGSVDLVLTKVKKVFRRPSSGGDAGPKKVKGLFDVSTTSRKSEGEVIEEIERVLKILNIDYVINNYIIKCKQGPVVKRGAKRDLEFTLEICLLPDLDIIGIKRKRNRGDVWRYKEICERIFATTHL